MSLPNEPNTRLEMYLNGIANGGEIPAEPKTRLEMYLDYIAQNGGGGGTTNYNALNNKPQINGVTLQGNKTTQELGILAGGSDVFDDYEDAVTAINEWAADHRGVGDNIYIRTMNVPDMWVSGVEETSVPYTYTTDQAIIDALTEDGYIQVGYYKLSALETQKVVIPQFENRTETWEKLDGTTEEVTYYVAQGGGTSV